MLCTLAGAALGAPRCVSNGTCQAASRRREPVTAARFAPNSSLEAHRNALPTMMDPDHVSEIPRFRFFCRSWRYRAPSTQTTTINIGRTSPPDMLRLTKPVLRRMRPIRSCKDARRCNRAIRGTRALIKGTEIRLVGLSISVVQRIVARPSSACAGVGSQ